MPAQRIRYHFHTNHQSLPPNRRIYLRFPSTSHNPSPQYVGYSPQGRASNRDDGTINFISNVLLAPLTPFPYRLCVHRYRPIPLPHPAPQARPPCPNISRRSNGRWSSRRLAAQSTTSRLQVHHPVQHQAQQHHLTKDHSSQTRSG